MSKAHNLIKSIICLSLIMLCPLATAASNINLPVGVTSISESQYNLHSVILWIITFIGVGVYGFMIYAIIHHRKSKGHKAHQFHESVFLEILWTVVPFAILIAMAVPATKTLIKMHDTSKADINIKITGYQWKWQYEYLEDDIRFFSNLSTPQEQWQLKKVNNESSTQETTEKSEHYLLEVDNALVLPINKKIRFLITANDVIHSWWVPELGVKKDAIPGFINESWAIIEQPGVYRGQCTELCGTYHGYMPVVVIAKTQEDYQQWLSQQKKGQTAAQANLNKELTLEELMQQGEQVYKNNCAICHKNDGSGVPGVFPKLKNSPIALGDINKHIEVVLKGVPGSAMQGYANQLNDAELAAVITYERNAWNNNPENKIVQSKDISNARSK